MPAVPLGDEFLVSDLQPGLLQPRAVGGRVRLAPPHRGLPAKPVLLSTRPGALAGHGQQPSCRAEPAADSPQQARLVVERHMDERIQADDGVEGREPEGGRGGVRPDERACRDQPACSLDLHVADVHAGYPVSGRGQRLGYRHAAAAADVEHRAAGWQAILQVGQPAGIPSGPGVVTAVTVGDCVVASAD